jgi:hypothetical protein
VRRHLVTWAAIVGLAAAIGLVGTATPALAASCFEATCDGKPLNGTDCATNQLIYDDYTTSDNHVKLQLMYSPGCHAFWGEIQVAGAGSAYGGLWAVGQYGGVEQLVEVGDTAGGALETHMWNSAGRSMKFCWGVEPGVDPGDTNDSQHGCTGWR